VTRSADLRPSGGDDDSGRRVDVDRRLYDRGWRGSALHRARGECLDNAVVRWPEFEFNPDNVRRTPGWYSRSTSGRRLRVSVRPHTRYEDHVDRQERSAGERGKRVRQRLSPTRTLERHTVVEQFLAQRRRNARLCLPRVARLP
jgi:hypothetical protein